MSLRLISLIICFCLCNLASCQQDRKDPGTLVPVEQVPVNDEAANPDRSAIPPQEAPVGDLTDDQHGAGQDAVTSIAIPQGTTKWPNGTDFPPEVVQILEKYHAGESLTADENITLRGFDEKWRNWDEIEAQGRSQQDS